VASSDPVTIKTVHECGGLMCAICEALPKSVGSVA